MHRLVVHRRVRKPADLDAMLLEITGEILPVCAGLGSYCIPRSRGRFAQKELSYMYGRQFLIEKRSQALVPDPAAHVATVFG